MEGTVASVVIGYVCVPYRVSDIFEAFWNATVCARMLCSSAFRMFLYLSPCHACWNLLFLHLRFQNFNGTQFGGGGGFNQDGGGFSQNGGFSSSQQSPNTIKKVRSSQLEAVLLNLWNLFYISFPLLLSAPAPQRDEQSMVPMTAKQFANATQKEDNKFVVDGKEINSATMCGVILNKTVLNTQVQYMIGKQDLLKCRKCVHIDTDTTHPLYAMLK